ncbi:MAG: VCBS repeat-containing protein [Pirellulaceae bacterium]
MPKSLPLCFLFAVIGMATVCCVPTSGGEVRFQALKCPRASEASTWKILERDGANRKVAPYLSSLGQGEGGMGVISSPPFAITTDSIEFTICGHDGRDGDAGKNHIVLVDTRKGESLRKTAAPGNDAVQERSWDVRELKGKEVRVEVRDGHRGGAFAWLGVGRIDAGAAMNVDFGEGMPSDWKRSQRSPTVRYKLISDGLPFRYSASSYNVIPNSGEVTIPCDFTARRLFMLGCTVGLGRPLEVRGGVELHYQSGKVDLIPLMVGFTLEGRAKRLSNAPSIHLHPSRDPFQYYLPVSVRDEPLQTIRLVTDPERGPIPRITAITVETEAESERLVKLPDVELSADERSWIETHAVSTDTVARRDIRKKIRAAYRLPEPPPTHVRFQKLVIDTKFRSEGVAVADFNDDGELDIAAGHHVYFGPEWTMQPLLGEPKAFPVKGYSDSFLCFDADVDGNGFFDLIVVGFPGQNTHWLRNPGKSGEPWRRHLAVSKTGNESPHFADITGDGHHELLFMSGNRCAFAHPAKRPDEPWPIQWIAADQDPGTTHGLGAGDVNGDGLTDVLSPNGWWQAPAEATPEPWRFHSASFFGGAQLLVADYDGDGDSDVLGSSPHGYGIAWTEQTAGGWEQHMIDDTISQTHAIHLADINQDGLVDFVTGKRFWAHNGHDPGSYEPAVLCWYEHKRADGKPTWVRHEIDADSGVGLHFAIVDINQNGLLDIVTSNKKGVFLFQRL